MKKTTWISREESQKFKEGSSSGLNASKSKLKIPDPIRQILSNRGICDEVDIQNWLSPTLSNMRSPFLMKDMDKAVARLLLAYENGEKIGIYGDFDLDGTPGVVLLLQGLSLLGFKNLQHYQPKRLSEGYGFHFHAVEKLKREGVSLILTVDVGITNIETVSKAKALGVDVIVTDHHLPKTSDTNRRDILLPDAVAVVNPNRPDCESGLGHLCGTGVAFFLILALRNRFQKLKLLETHFEPKELLDLFAIATLTDMVPLVDENRVLVKHGIIELAKTDRSGLKILLKELGLSGRALTGADVAIRFSPKLNALSRMEMGVLPLDVFLAETDEEAKKLIKDVLEKNELRVKLQKEAEQDALSRIDKQDLSSFVWVYSEEYHKGVVGLVATRLSQKYGVPAFVGNCNGEGVITGSARIPDDNSGFNLVEILEKCKESLMHFGGHAGASGFSLKKEQEGLFVELLNKSLADSVKVGAREAVIHFDGIMDLSDLTPRFMKWYEALGPFGVAFETPVFCFNGLTVVSVRELNGGHLKLKIKDRSGYSLDTLWFYPDKGHVIFEKGLVEGLELDVLAEPQWNYFAGRKSLQLLLKDVRKKNKSNMTYSGSLKEVTVHG